jgi:hypothetical protein
VPWPGRTDHDHRRPHAFRPLSEFDENLGSVYLGQIQVQENKVGAWDATGRAHVTYDGERFPAIPNRMQFVADAMFLGVPVA